MEEGRNWSSKARVKTTSHGTEKTNYKLGKITLHILSTPADHRSPHSTSTSTSTSTTTTTPTTTTTTITTTTENSSISLIQTLRLKMRKRMKHDETWWTMMKHDNETWIQNNTNQYLKLPMASSRPRAWLEKAPWVETEPGLRMPLPAADPVCLGVTLIALWQYTSIYINQ